VAEASVPEEERLRLDRWLAAGMHGTMGWMARGAAARKDPSLLHPGARSVLVGAVNYWSPPPPREGGGRISVYALGRDYHGVLRKMLHALRSRVESVLPGARARLFVDSAPVLEKYFAWRAGIGWRGKNGNLILSGRGSWFFLCGMILDRELPPDRPAADRCGSCTACLSACPTGAIFEPYRVDGSRCISYLTIERRGPVPPDLDPLCGDWMFGCDVCQEVCPWNRRARRTEVGALRPMEERGRLTFERALSLGPEGFDALFAGSAVRRAGWERFRVSAERAARNASEERR
jgi:epoxyqueuosine reductase